MAKKPTKKTIQETTTEPELVFSAHPAEETVQENITKMPESKGMKHYSFKTIVSNLNIRNVIFNNVPVEVFSINATSKKQAIDSYKNKILAHFNGDMNLALSYMTSVYGGSDNVLVEESEIGAINSTIEKF